MVSPTHRLILNDEGQWSRLSGCSASCGGGETLRTRFHQYSGMKAEESELCNDTCCPKWNDWSEWSPCGQTCGRGKQEQAQLMSVRVSLTTFKLEHAVSNFPRCHIIDGLIGVNALQRALVVSWFELLDIFVVKCSDVTPPLVVQRDTGKNGDHGLDAVLHMVVNR